MRLRLSKLRIAPTVISTIRPAAMSIITTSVAARWSLIVLLAYRRVGQPSPKLVRVESVTSTQDVARPLPIGSIVVAEHQTAGRGGLDRRRGSPPRRALVAVVVRGPGPGLG